MRNKPTTKTGLHPRNRHRGQYDFEQLVKSCPELQSYVLLSHNKATIDFANPIAVKILNKALLKYFYRISNWDIPALYLCPPIPGRADYIHYIADLLSSCRGGKIPCGPAIRILDIGVGANCVYPIIGHAEYGWQFLGTDIDPVALASAKQIVQSNEGLADAIQLRMQMSSSRIFLDLLKDDEVFDVSICNPPFHASLAEAQEGTRRKWRNLGKDSRSEKGRSEFPLLNFGGHNSELWCKDGEKGFVCRMIEESSKIPKKCIWFSTLISKETTLPSVYAALKKAKVLESRTIDMAQGQKKSRIVAWSFQKDAPKQEWKIQNRAMK